MSRIQLVPRDPSVLPGYSPAATFLESFPDVELTDEHPSSSYGQPVLVWRGVGYGPLDLPGLELHAYHDTPPEMIASGRVAGWQIHDYQRV